MVNSLENKAQDSLILDSPRFIDHSLLPPEASTDPDYRLKMLQQEYGGEYSITCSKCHHCR